MLDIIKLDDQAYQSRDLSLLDYRLGTSAAYLHRKIYIMGGMTNNKLHQDYYILELKEKNHLNNELKQEFLPSSFKGPIHGFLISPYNLDTDFIKIMSIKITVINAM